LSPINITTEQSHIQSTKHSIKSVTPQIQQLTVLLSVSRRLNPSVIHLPHAVPNAKSHPHWTLCVL